MEVAGITASGGSCHASVRHGSLGLHRLGRGRRTAGAGHEVTGLARSPASADRLTALGADVTLATLADTGSLHAAAAASDGVIHLAYRHGEPSGVAAATDRQVIEMLGDALAGSGRPLVVTSGTLVLPAGRVGTESDAPDPAAPAGARAAGERAALALAGAGCACRWCGSLPACTNASSAASPARSSTPRSGPPGRLPRRRLAALARPAPAGRGPAVPARRGAGARRGGPARRRRAGRASAGYRRTHRHQARHTRAAGSRRPGRGAFRLARDPRRHRRSRLKPRPPGHCWPGSPSIPACSMTSRTASSSREHSDEPCA